MISFVTTAGPRLGLFNRFVKPCCAYPYNAGWWLVNFLAGKEQIFGLEEELVAIHSPWL